MTMVKISNVIAIRDYLEVSMASARCAPCAPWLQNMGEKTSSPVLSLYPAFYSPLNVVLVGMRRLAASKCKEQPFSRETEILRIGKEKNVEEGEKREGSKGGSIMLPSS